MASFASQVDRLRHRRKLAAMVFEEFPPFTRRLLALLNDDDFARLQVLLLTRPDAGKVIPKSGGLRKVRWAAKGHGKRGGARVIYYWIVARDRILLLDIYAKSEEEDLSQREIRQLRTLVEEHLR